MVSPSLIIEQVIAGLSIGSRLFLVAVGLSLIFGVMDVLNFTHGVLYMLGAYVAIVSVDSLVGNFWLGVVAAAVGVSIVGLVMEVIFFRRLYHREHLDQLLLTFGLVLILTDIVRAVFGLGTHLIQTPAPFDFSTSLAGVTMPSYRIFVITMSVLVFGGLLLVMKRTNIGRVVRATSTDRQMARQLGINVPVLYTGVFVAGTALAALGGALAAPVQAVTPTLGDQVIVMSFVIVVIGGLGSFKGAFVGAYLIGITIALGSITIPGAGQLLPFVAMIAVLLVKPEGLLGGIEA